MVIRSKSSRFVKALFSRKLRVTAFILGCIFAAVSLAGASYTMSMSMISDRKENYVESREYREALGELYGELYVFSAAYLDPEERDDLMDEFLLFMDYNDYKYRKTDDGIIPVPDMFDYYVSYEYDCGNGESIVRYTTNIDDALDAMEVYRNEDEVISLLTSDHKHYITRRDNTVSGDFVSSGEINTYSFPNAESGYYNYFGSKTSLYTTEHYSSSFVPVGGWFKDNYGRHFYNVGFAEPVVLYASTGDSERDAIARAGETEVRHYYIRDDDDEMVIVDELPEGMDEPMDYYYDYTFIEELDDYEAYRGSDEGITIFIAPKTEMLEAAAADYRRLNTNYTIASVFNQVGALIFAVMAVYLVIAGGFEMDEEGRVSWKSLPGMDKLFTELLAVMFIAAIAVMAFILDKYDSIIYEFHKLGGPMGAGEAVCAAALLLPVALGMASAEQAVVKLKQRRFIKDLLIYRIFRAVLKKYRSSAFYEKRLHRTAAERMKGDLKLMIISSGAVVIAAFVSVALYWDDDLLLITAPLAFIVFLVGLIDLIRLQRDISKLSRKIAAVGKNEPFNEKVKETSPVYGDILTLSNIDDNVRRAVEEQIKSEKMKIELVANVSHDLKTPLTSIISYIDLLKKLELDDEAEGYVQILDRKSQKLKSIVQDVFSLAKATSGIEVSMERLDLVMLINQCLADQDDLLSNCGRSIRTEIKETSAMIMGDGPKLYRVLQNLIGNAVKYSLAGTRIFIDVFRRNDDIIFSIKNVSEAPLDFTAEEITERFVRGDKSRTDGGSGLGLSIAKTFTEACGGSFEIELDGDMFKARVIMPIIAGDVPGAEDMSESENSDKPGIIQDN